MTTCLKDIIKKWNYANNLKVLKHCGPWYKLRKTVKCSTISKENAMLGTPICLFFLFIRGQNQYWEHPFACSFYFYFDNFKKQKTTIAPMDSSIFFVENEIKLNFFSTLNLEKKINMWYIYYIFLGQRFDIALFS